MNNMNSDAVIKNYEEHGALLRGHFLLSSGRHSNQYVQCAKLLRFPDKAAEVLKDVAEQVKDLGITKICRLYLLLVFSIILKSCSSCSSPSGIIP